MVVRVCSCKEKLFIQMCTDFDQNYTSQWVVTPIGLVWSCTSIILTLYDCINVHKTLIFIVDVNEGPTHPDLMYDIPNLLGFMVDSGRFLITILNYYSSNM